LTPKPKPPPPWEVGIILPDRAAIRQRWTGPICLHMSAAKGSLSSASRLGQTSTPALFLPLSMAKVTDGAENHPGVDVQPPGHASSYALSNRDGAGKLVS